MSERALPRNPICHLNVAKNGASSEPEKRKEKRGGEEERERETAWAVAPVERGEPTRVRGRVVMVVVVVVVVVVAGGG